MTLSELETKLSLTVICRGADREITGVYAGDLLSRAMSHVKEGNVWLTIMANKNTLAVATLADPSAIILAEGVTLPEDAKEAATINAVTVYSSDKSVYELALQLGKLLPNDHA